MRSSDSFFMAHEQLTKIDLRPEMFMLHHPCSSKVFSEQLHWLQAVVENNLLSVAHKTDHYRLVLPRNQRSTLLNSLGKNEIIADPIYFSSDHLRQLIINTHVSKTFQGMRCFAYSRHTLPASMPETGECFSLPANICRQPGIGLKFSISNILFFCSSCSRWQMKFFHMVSSPGLTHITQRRCGQGLCSMYFHFQAGWKLNGWGSDTEHYTSG